MSGGRDKGEVSIRSASLSAWIPKINRAYGQGIAATLRFAHVVSQARRSLEKGDWTKLCSSGEVPFRIRQGQMLIRIDEKLSDLDAQTSACLPWRWTILYQISRLPRHTLLSLVQEEVITPFITEKAAAALVQASVGRASPRAAHFANITRRLKGFRDFIENHLNELTTLERHEIAEVFDSLLLLLRGPAGRALPLPQGEGRREGEGTVQTAILPASSSMFNSPANKDHN